MQTRREFIKRTVAGGVGLMAGGALLNTRAPTALAATPALTPYVDPMPTLLTSAIDATGGLPVSLTASLVSRKVHRDLPATTLFGYLQPGGPVANDTYIGPVIIAKNTVPLAVSYTNGLASDDFTRVFTNGGSSYTQFLPQNDQVVKILTHLHGGFVASVDDGNPFASSAVPSGGIQTVTYPNEQPATLSWYHDHYLGDTRMNVVAGLAGGYLLRDSFDTGTNPVLPGPIGMFELAMVVQDRQFTPKGELLYPVNPVQPPGPWIGEYFGDVMLVNGKIWPTLAVQPAVYRFRILNGCNARILSLRIARSNDQTVPMFIVGTEGGLLTVNPVGTNRLVMAPAERFDVICDFTRLAGQTLLLKNNNPPSPVSTPAPSLTQVMQITVTVPLSPGAPTTVPPTLSIPSDYPVRTAVDALTGLGPPKLSGGSVAGRIITLNEVGAGTPAWKLNLNAVPYGDPNPLIETLTWKSVEDWYFVNTTPDTHPMHTHLFTFRVMGRYNIDVKGLVARYGGANGLPQLDNDVTKLAPFLKSGLMAPPPEETGLKETVKANPGQVTVVRARFLLPSTALVDGQLVTPQKYVHHCHIVEHEDNDMMERVVVAP